MSLDWNAEKIEGWDEWRADKKNWALAQVVIFATIPLEMGEITHENFDEFWWRLNAFQHAFGPLLWDTKPGGREAYWITQQDLSHLIGLKTNVPTKSKASFIKKLKEVLYRRLMESLE